MKKASVNMRRLTCIGYRVFPQVLIATGGCDQIWRTIDALSRSYVREAA